MKIKNNKILILMLILSIFISCDLDDLQTSNIQEDKAIVDLRSAENALAGLYDKTRLPNIHEIAGVYFTAGIEQVSGAQKLDGMLYNTPNLNNEVLLNFYKDCYSGLDASARLIKAIKIGKVKDATTEQKNVLLAQGKTIRALFHLMLLKTFGQFYDINSQYGVVLIDKPISDGDEKRKRVTVKEVYDLILKDLQFAVKHAPNDNEIPSHAYISKITAKALLAKVYLYRKEYDKAAKMSLDVIQAKSTYQLEERGGKIEGYKTIFDNQWNSAEVLFAPSFSLESNSESYLFFGIQYFTPTEYLKNLADKQVEDKKENGEIVKLYDPRYTFTYEQDPKEFELFYNKYKKMVNGDSNINTIYYMRMAEVYLIYAEAKTRANNAFSIEAKEKLDKIRTRVGLQSSKATTKEELLKDIFNEKLLELSLERGESWFDLVRYIDLGDLSFKEKKIKNGDLYINPITNKNQLIFPIPIAALRGNHKLIQNPGY